MPQYGILVYSPAPADPMTLGPDHLAELEEYPAKAVELGGKILGASYFAGQRGFAFESSEGATAIRGDQESPGPLHKTDLVPAAFFVVSARNQEIAVSIARLHPAARDGGVEVRELVPAPKG